MTLSALAWIGLCLVLIILFSFWDRKNPKRALRDIPALRELRRHIDLSVEDGTRLHISLGRGSILGPESAAAFAALTLLQRVADIAADSDQPPTATTGDGAILLLAQDTLRNNFQRQGISNQYHLLLAQASGLTPFSYAAGALPPILDRAFSATAFLGNYGEEAALLTSATQHSASFSLGSSNNLTGQAIYYADANRSLLGEEIFAIGAYLDAGVTHQASLRAQDVLRWMVIGLLIITAVVPLFTGQP